MLNYKNINNISGWLVFIISLAVYIVTLEPTASFWDCGEFISCAYKLQVPHPPGSPLFMLLGRLFTMHIPIDGTPEQLSQVAYWINMVSAVSSAATVLFLYWTITLIGRKLLKVSASVEPDMGLTIGLIASGVVGSLAYAFTDSFWFSAVEAEVYALSSFFTAFVFWGIMKWESVAEDEGSWRWLLLIAFMIGLSTGVHLLNLVAIPALGFVFYFKKYKFSISGFIATLIISFGILYFVLIVVIQKLPEWAGVFEIYSVNELGMGFEMGAGIFFGLLFCSLIILLFLSNKLEDQNLTPLLITIIVVQFGYLFLSAWWMGLIYLVVTGAIWYSVKDNPVQRFCLIAYGLLPGYLVYHYGFKDKALSTTPAYAIKRFTNLATLMVTFILMGFSTYAIITIRSNFDPPIDENNPENFIKLLSYLKREQYGDRPLTYGPQYTARGPISYEEGAPKYRREDSTYVIYDHKVEPQYSPEHMVMFPRMHSMSTGPNHVAVYTAWMKEHYPRHAAGKVPTGAQNIHYFFDRQIGHMYNRYFKWNFVGRDGDVQDAGSIGFSGGNASKPEVLKSGARNQYYALPLLLGVIGLVFMALKSREDLFVTVLLFLFTGAAIIIYLNNPAFEPRERDYTYVGSFYVFAIWIGLGVLGIFNGLRSGILFEKGSLLTNEVKLPVKLGSVPAAIIALLITASVPGILVAENWDDHDRSDRYFSIDQAKNLLESCAPNAILFTGGDNDTFPLWYVQEVEGYRRDVRVCNLSLLNTDWYIDQMRRKAYISEPLPISLEPKDYREGSNDYAYLAGLRNLPPEQRADFTGKGTMDVAKYIRALRANSPEVRKLTNAEFNKYETVLPTRNLVLNIDAEAIFKVEKDKESRGEQGMLPLEIEGRVRSQKLVWDIGRNSIYKKHFIMLDMIANIAADGWDRPIYFSAGISREDYLNLDDYMILEGMAYRLVPVKVKNAAKNEEYVNTEVMYTNLMEKYHFRNLDRADIFYSEDYNRMVRSHRLYYYLLADFMMKKDKARAKKVLEFSLAKMPDAAFPLEAGYISLRMIDMMHKTELSEEADALTVKIVDRTFEMIDYRELEEKSYKMQSEKLPLFRKNMQDLLGIDGVASIIMENTEKITAEQAKLFERVIRKNVAYLDKIQAKQQMEPMRNDFSRSIFATFDFLDKMRASGHGDLIKDLEGWEKEKGKLIGRE